MTPRKLNVMIATFPYAGNGQASAEHPDCRRWYVKTVQQMKADPRVGDVRDFTLADTPLTMSRNRAVVEARASGVDVLLMLDSDNTPDFHLGEAGQEEFWKSSFDFLYNHYEKGPCVIGAPYCGPPGGTENVYVFRWESFGSLRGNETPFALVQYTRGEAFNMAGIQNCAALPTGLIMYDMRCFELIEPSHLSKEQVLRRVAAGEMTIEEGVLALRDGFFSYEWKSGYADDKASTEDVQNTRDIALAGQVVLGYNPVYCNWNSWAGHWKPWCVGKPRLYCNEQIAANFKQAVMNQHSVWERFYHVDKTAEFAHLGRPAYHDTPAPYVAGNGERGTMQPGVGMVPNDDPVFKELDRLNEHLQQGCRDPKALKRATIAELYRQSPPPGTVTLSATDACGTATAGPPVFNYDGRSEG